MLKLEKPKEIGTIKKLTKESTVIGILNMHKMPARALQQIRNELDAKIRMSRKTLMIRALKESGKDIEKLSEHMKGSPAFLFSEKNPFKLYATIKNARMPSSAKPGDIATKDITINKGPTPLVPGPAISQLQKVGLKTSVQEGKIHVVRDKLVCKKGEEITADLANVLGALKIEPMEIGLDLVAVFEKGIIYTQDVLDIDKDEYIKQLKLAITAAINVSLNTGYITKESVSLTIQKAFAEAKSLCVSAGIFEKEFVGIILAKAAAEAAALEKKTG